MYVGKAKDLKRRVNQYFDRGIQDPKTIRLVSEIRGIQVIKTHSEFDALLLEARLIRKHNPKYNIIAKDDKSPLYLCISTDEQLPRITYVRKSSITQNPKRQYFGPFQSGKTIKKVMRQLRMIIPYCTQKVRDGKPCFYTHLGLCNPCPSVLTTSKDMQLIKLYQTHSKQISDILSGKSLTVLHDMEDRMKQLAAQNKFEEAEKEKHEIIKFRQLIDTHYDPLLYETGDSFLENIYETEMEQLHSVLLPYYPTLSLPVKIECIDISNTLGEFATGSLVVLVNGIPSHDTYRRFRIRLKNAPNDVAMIAEVLSRRLNHSEWPYPDLLVIDGGKGQVKSAKKVLVQNNAIIPVIGLAKRFENIIVPTGDKYKTIRLPANHRGLMLLERLRDESHRFALTYHRLLRRKNFGLTLSE